MDAGGELAVDVYAIHQLQYHVLLAKLEMEGPSVRRRGALLTFLQQKYRWADNRLPEKQSNQSGAPCSR